MPHPFVKTLAACTLASTAALCAAQSYLPKLGGPGGGQFSEVCPWGMNLMGLDLRAGDDVDAIRPVCVTSYGKAAVGRPSVAQTWHGGAGGQAQSLRCPERTPLISGIGIDTEGVDTVIVNSIRLFCSEAGSVAAPNPNPSAVFEGPAYVPSKPALGFGVGGAAAFQTAYRQDCPMGQVAVGVHGRSGKWLDAVGLVCDLPRITPGNGISLGRVASTSPAGAPARSICEAASAARARNSPAAADLEAQCNAHSPAKSIGRVPDMAPRGGAPESICDRAASARDRQSPAAASLQAQCLRLGGRLPDAPSGDAANLDELTARGEAMVGMNPLAAELRARQPLGPLRQGFDIGMAVIDRDTAWGPGKQKILDSLSAPQQEGFKLAASLTLDQNRNAELVQIGSGLVDADPPLAQARSRETDPRFRLGFDVASGLFGNPALGAKGNTASGPGSLAIRDALNATAQRGFNTSMQLHLSRRY